jgi:hypothetical protein
MRTLFERALAAQAERLRDLPEVTEIELRSIDVSDVQAAVSEIAGSQRKRSHDAAAGFCQTET